MTTRRKLKFKMKEYKSYSKEKLNDEFVLACQNDNLELIKYLLASLELKEHADIHALEDAGFRWACWNGNLEVVKYLLSSQELKDHANIQASNNDGFIGACGNGHLEVVKYLLTSSELKEQANIHADNDRGFRFACRRGYSEIIKFLIFDMNIDETVPIKKLLNSEYQEVKNLFQIRDLNKQLENELDSSCHKKKNKV